MSEGEKAPSRAKNIEAIHGLSPLQAAILPLVVSASDTHVGQVGMELTGKVDADALRKACQLLLDRHAALRTGFIWEQVGKPVQVVSRHVEVIFETHDLAHGSNGEPAKRAVVLAQDVRRQGFVLSKAPLVRFDLFRVGAEKHYFYITIHHLVSDARSDVVLIQELLIAYEAFATRKAPSLPTPRPYADFLGWVKQRDEERGREYWQKYLDAARGPTRVSRSLPGPQTKGPSDVQTLSLKVPRDLNAKLEALARELGVTWGSIIQAVMSLVLARRSGEQDVLFLTAIDGRPRDLPGSERMIGLCVNTVPVRAQVDKEAKLSNWVQALNRRLGESIDFSHFALAQVRQWAKIPAGEQFEVVVIVTESPMEVEGGWEVASVRAAPMSSHVRPDLPLAVFAHPGEHATISLVYEPRYLDAQGAGEIYDGIGILLNAAVEAPHQEVGGLLEKLPLQCLPLFVMSTFTASPIAPYLRFLLRELAVPCRVNVAPYGQIVQQLLDPNGSLKEGPCVAVALVRLEDLALMPSGALNPRSAGKTLTENARRLFEAARAASTRGVTAILLCLCPISDRFREGVGGADVVRDMVDSLAAGSAGIQGLAFVDCTTIRELYGTGEIHDPVSDEVGHVPYFEQGFAAIAATVVRKLTALGRVSPSLLVLDAEDLERSHAILEPHLSALAARNKRLCLWREETRPSTRKRAGEGPTVAKEGISFGKCGADAATQEFSEKFGIPLSETAFLSSNQAACDNVERVCADAFVIRLPADEARLGMFLRHLWLLDGEPSPPV